MRSIKRTLERLKKWGVGAALAAAPVTSASAVEVWKETFEGFTLEPYTSASETSAGDGTDWTASLPANWGMSLGASVPEGDPKEFRGWRLHDVDSWITTEGNQDRALWPAGGVGAHNTVAVADGDAFDDGTNVDPLNFITMLMTPSIDLATYKPNSVKLTFDSSFRAEGDQNGKVEVSFDGTNYTSLLDYTTASVGANVVANQSQSLNVNNPSTGSMSFRFTYTAGNNWWWAIDNVAVSAEPVPEPSTLAIAAMAVGAAGIFSLRRKS